MKLIGDIINELMDVKIPLEGALLKTKYLATKIQSVELLTWVNGELNGFENESDLPAYRITNGMFTGSYMNGQRHYSKMHIPIGHLPNDELDILTRIISLDSISAVEQLMGRKDLKYSVPAKKKLYIEQSIRGLGNHYFQITNMHLEMPVPFLTNIISSVRSKLLDFMLKLEEEFGENTELQELRNGNNTITHIMNTTINNSGDGAVITSGTENKIKANITVNKGNKEVLKETLKSSHVSNKHVQDLLQIIDDQPATALDQYSVPVNNWIKKMFNKAIDGSWQVGIGAAGGILGDAIASYYGLK